MSISLKSPSCHRHAVTNNAKSNAWNQNAQNTNDHQNVDLLVGVLPVTSMHQ